MSKHKQICIGFTQKGEPCKKLAAVGLYCSIHKSSVNPIVDNTNIIDNIDFKLINFSELKAMDITNETHVNVKTLLGDCAICTVGVYAENDAKLKCGHHYHLECISKLHNSRCPTCRAELKSDLINENLVQTINERTYEDDNSRNYNLAREWNENNVDDEPFTRNASIEDVFENATLFYFWGSISFEEYLMILSGHELY